MLLVALAATLADERDLRRRARRCRRGAASTALREAGRGVTGGARQRRLRSAIVVVEVGLAMVVVIGAGLLVRSFITLTTRNPGFDPDHVLSFNVQFVKTS